MTIAFILNNQPVEINVKDGDEPLVWVLREKLNLKGTKYGCGKAACGACTLLVDGVAFRSCTYPVKLLQDKTVTTIEGLGTHEVPHPIQSAWLEEVVPQCGYCQPGFIMATAGLLNATPNPTDEDINKAITNICRCGTYYRMRKAIHKAVALAKTGKIEADAKE